jgi:hypothetical protein
MRFRDLRHHAQRQQRDTEEEALRPGPDHQAGVAGPDSGATDRGPRDGEGLGAHEVVQRDVVGHREGELGRHRDALRDQAGHVHPDDHPVRARRREPRATWRAAQAAVVGLDRHPLADPPVPDCRADADDLTDALVAEHPRHVRHWPGAGMHPEVGAAQPDTPHAHEHLVGPALGLGHVDGLDLAWANQRRCLHHELRSRCAQPRG